MELTVNRISPFRKFWDPTLIFTGTSIMTLNPETGEATSTCSLSAKLPGRATPCKFASDCLSAWQYPSPSQQQLIHEPCLSCCRQIQVTCGHLVGAWIPTIANLGRVWSCNAGDPGFPRPAKIVLAALASAATVKHGQPCPELMLL